MQRQERILKVLTCWRLMSVKLQQEKTRFAEIEKLHRENSKKLYTKLTGMMVGRCYKTITVGAANEFVEKLMRNKTNIDVSSYVPVNFKHFENPKVDLELSDDEKLYNKLLTKVHIIVQRRVELGGC
eukprot:TRINITY_DN7003_c0_g1_i16.p3 TRINITY_DN7003_c0_g1~~TRINITY_DN7003_c0_g1_i16.p3  ORF type:complete len:127 (+),score=37.74 TRINITY_DN7003_c0_g1_i16:290-670(+)